MRYMRALILVLLLAQGFLSVSAQMDTIPPAPLFRYEKLRVGFSPSAFLNTYPGLQLSIDKGVRSVPQFNFTLEVASIFRFNTFGERRMRGYRIKPGLEWLLARVEPVGVSLGFYWDLRQTIWKRVEYVSHWDEQYREYADISRTTVLSGGLFGLNLVVHPTPRLMIEGGFALGLGFYTVTDEPKEGYRSQRTGNIFLSLDDGNYSFPLMSFNLNFSYILKTYSKH